MQIIIGILLSIGSFIISNSKNKREKEIDKEKYSKGSQ